MAELKDIENGLLTGKTRPEIDQLAGLSLLLTAPFAAAPAHPQGERRSGQDRRVGDRRVTAREFKVPE